MVCRYFGEKILYSCNLNGGIYSSCNCDLFFFYCGLGEGGTEMSRTSFKISFFYNQGNRLAYNHTIYLEEIYNSFYVNCTRTICCSLL